jgi:hypothetical protein
VRSSKHSHYQSADKCSKSCVHFITSREYKHLLTLPILQNTAKKRHSQCLNTCQTWSYSLLLFLLAGLAFPVFGQETEPSPHTITLYAEGSGFIAIRETYRLNYESDLGGLPIEVSGGLQFPIDHRLSAGLTARYRRRTVTFIPDVSLRSLELEPGIQYYLEEPHEGDIRMVGDVGLILARMTAEGPIQSTTNGQTAETRKVVKDYLNLGFGVGLSIEYPFTTLSAAFAHVHLSTMMLDPIDEGGLGNVGGISIGLGYKLSF